MPTQNGAHTSKSSDLIITDNNRISGLEIVGNKIRDGLGCRKCNCAESAQAQYRAARISDASAGRQKGAFRA